MAVPVEASLSKSVRTGEKALTEQCVRDQLVCTIF